jgi:excisionase family DNA binding protein
MYLTAAEACERLRVSRDTLHKMIKTGILKAHKAGKGVTSPYRISEEDIAAYIERQTARAAS